MSDIVGSRRDYRRMLRILRATTAAGTTLPRVVVRRSAGDGWYPALLLSDRVSGSSTVRVLALSSVATMVSDDGLFAQKPLFWSQWPGMELNEVSVGDVRVLASADQRFEHALDELDRYFSARDSAGDPNPLTDALIPICRVSAPLPSQPPVGSAPLDVSPHSKILHTAHVADFDRLTKPARRWRCLVNPDLSPRYIPGLMRQLEYAKSAGVFREVARDGRVFTVTANPAMDRQAEMWLRSWAALRSVTAIAPALTTREVA